VPQDIHSASHAKSLPSESESPKVDKPLSPSAGKTFPEMSKPPSPEDTSTPVGAAGNPTFPSVADSGCDAAHQSPRSDPIERQEASPQSPKSFGLGAHGGPQHVEGSSVPRPEKQPRQYSCVAEFLWDNPDFIQTGFHIGRYVTASVNIKVEREQIRVRMNLERFLNDIHIPTRVKYYSHSNFCLC
jgi:hypothetical protein